MPIEPGIIDANVLAYAIDADSSQNLASRALLDAARHPSAKLYVTAQILCEFYSVITNPKRVARVTLADEAVTIISDLLGLPGLHILSDTCSNCPATARPLAAALSERQRYLRLTNRRDHAGQQY